MSSTDRPFFIGNAGVWHRRNSAGDRYSARTRGLNGANERAIAPVKDTRYEAMLDLVRYVLNEDEDFKGAFAELADVAHGETAKRDKDRLETIKRILTDVLPDVDSRTPVVNLAERVAVYVGGLRAQLDDAGGEVPINTSTSAQQAPTPSDNTLDTIMSLQAEVDWLSAELEITNQVLGTPGFVQLNPFYTAVVAAAETVLLTTDSCGIEYTEGGEVFSVPLTITHNDYVSMDDNLDRAYAAEFRKRFGDPGVRLEGEEWVVKAYETTDAEPIDVDKTWQSIPVEDVAAAPESVVTMGTASFEVGGRDKTKPDYVSLVGFSPYVLSELNSISQHAIGVDISEDTVHPLRIAVERAIIDQSSYSDMRSVLTAFADSEHDTKVCIKALNALADLGAEDPATMTAVDFLRTLSEEGDQHHVKIAALALLAVCQS